MPFHDLHAIKTIKKIFLAFFLIVLIPQSNVFADHGKDVAVILSMDISPYRKALQGAASEIKGDFRLYKLSEYNRDKLEHDIIKNHDGKVILAVGSNALLFSLKHFQDKPVIFTMIPNPEHLYTNHKYNISGVRMETPWNLIFKQLKDISKYHNKIGTIVNSKTTTLQNADEIKKIASKNNLEIDVRSVKNISEAISVFQDLENNIDTFILSSDPKIYTNKFYNYMLASSLQRKFILVGPSSVFTEKGSLFSIMGDNYDWGKQAGKMVKAFLNEENQGTMSNRFAEKYNLSINIKTAKKIGVKISFKVISSASQIVK